MSEIQQDFPDLSQKTTQEKKPKQQKEKKPKQLKEKKPRAYSFIQAFAEWRKENNWTGLCPKKDTPEYKQIKELYDTRKQS